MKFKKIPRPTIKIINHESDKANKHYPPRYVYPEIAVDEVTVESGFAASIEDLFKDDENVPW